MCYVSCCCFRTVQGYQVKAYFMFCIKTETSVNQTIQLSLKMLCLNVIVIIMYSYFLFSFINQQRGSDPMLLSTALNLKTEKRNIVSIKKYIYSKENKN